MDDHYDRIERLRRQLDANEAVAATIRAELHTAIVDALRVGPHGVQNEVARRSGYSRERVAQIRKAADAKETPDA